MKRIIVDIDNTLWDLAPVLRKHLLTFNPSIPPLEEWSRWDFWRGYVPDKVFYGALEQIHLRQDRYEPFAESRTFLATLKEWGLYVIIASHRHNSALGPTVRWLNKNDLPFDEVHLSYDKSVLFPGSWALVDDSPAVLEKAREAGILRVRLRYPWNEKLDHPLFNGLPDILVYLAGLCLHPR